MISIGIIEDKKEIRETLIEFFKIQDNIICMQAEESVEDFFKNLNPSDPYDILLLDIELPGISGLNAIPLIKEKLPNINIIILTVYEDEEKIFNALRNGASGYLLKNTPFPKLKSAIEELYSGGAPMSPLIARKVIDFFSFSEKKEQIKSPLTPKEREIVAALVDGLSYKNIATNLGNSVDTIRHHIKNIYKKLEVNSRAEVVAKSVKSRLL